MKPLELAKKYGATYTPPSPQDLQSLASKYGATFKPAEQRIERGIVGSALNTLLVRPAARATEALGRTGLFGQTVKTGFEEMQGQNQELRLPGAERAIGTVEPQKALGEGGATQIFSNALESATYLAPYGKIATGATTLASKVAGEGAPRIIGGAVAGATGGYATDVAQNLDEQERVTVEAFKPGFATLLGGLTGGTLEAGAKGLENILKNSNQLSRELQEQTFKLTPTQRTKLGSRLDDLVTYANKNIPSGTAESRYAHTDDLYQNAEDNLQFFLETVAKENRLSTSVKKDTFFRQLRAIKGKTEYKFGRDADVINKQIDSVIDTISKQYPGETIPVDKLNIFKRSTFQNAYNKAGDKVLDFVEHDIGEAAKIAIERAVKGGTIGGKDIGTFNKEYGDLIQLRKIFRLAQNRPDIGFTKRIGVRIIGGIIGNALGGIPGLIGGEFIAEPLASKVAGTQAKSFIASKLSKLKPVKIGSVIQRLRQ